MADIVNREKTDPTKAGLHKVPELRSSPRSVAGAGASNLLDALLASPILAAFYAVNPQPIPLAA